METNVEVRGEAGGFVRPWWGAEPSSDDLEANWKQFRLQEPAATALSSVGFALDCEAMALHLEEISLAVAPDAHALVLLDQAGWHVLEEASYPRRARSFPLSTLREHSDLSAAIYSTERSTYGIFASPRSCRVPFTATSATTLFSLELPFRSSAKNPLHDLLLMLQDR